MGNALVVLQKVAQALLDCGINWYVGGSMASTAHGVLRTTQDVDFVVALRLEHIDLLVSALESEFYIDALAIRRAIFGQSSFNLIYLGTMYKADIFMLKDTPFAQEQMRRRQQIALPGEEGETIAWVCTAEDIVLQKLLWYQKGGGVSEQQWRDVQGVLQVQAQALDQAYMQHWARELGLTELLTRALVDAGMKTNE